MVVGRQKKKKRDIKLSVKNLGPMESGKIEIKPLTVLIGKNQSGKSYLSLLIYSIFTSPNNDLILRSNQNVNDEFFTKISKEFNKFILENLNEKDKLEIPDKYIKEIFDYNINTYSESIFSRLQKLTYSQKIQDITSFEKNNLLVDINTGGFKLSLKSAESEDYGNDSLYQKLGFKFSIETDTIGNDDSSISIGIETPDDDWASLDINFKIIGYNNLKSKTSRSKELKNTIITKIIESINILIHTKIKSLIYRPTYYFPAGRAGILQGYRLFTHQMYSIMSSPEISEINKPLVSGNLTEFMALINSLSTNSKSTLFKTEIKKLEKNILCGEIYLKKNESYIDSEIRFKTSYGVDMPLLRASSTVSELAPLFLLLKNRIQKHDTIIIEELEAHLHPENQEKVAALIVKLIRNEINVIMTTHSDYLLERINHYLLLSKLDEQERISCGYDSNLYLNSEEISINLLRQKKGKRTFFIKNLKLNDTEGIPQDEFRDISMNLYNNTVDILEKVQNKYE